MNLLDVYKFTHNLTERQLFFSLFFNFIKTPESGVGGNLLRASLRQLVPYIGNQVHATVGIAPFIVVPRNNFEEAFFPLQVVLKRGQRIVNRRSAVVDKIR